MAQLRGFSPCGLFGDASLIRNLQKVPIFAGIGSLIDFRYRLARSMYTAIIDQNGCENGSVERILGVAGIPLFTSKPTRYGAGSVRCGEGNGVCRGTLQRGGGLLEYEVENLCRRERTVRQVQ